MAQQGKSNVWIDGVQAGATLAQLKKAVAGLNKEISQLPRNSEEYNKKLKELSQANAALNQHRNQIRGIGDSFTTAKTNMKSMISQYAPFSLMITGVSALFGGIVAGVRNWYTANREMEKSLSSLKALTGASAKDIQWYKKEAIAMGMETTRSANEVVNAYKLIGSAKPELLTNKEALSALTKEAIILSDAAELDLAVSVDALTGTLNQFGKGAEAGRQVINAMAAGAQAGAADIESLTTSTEKSGAAANAMGVTIEENIGLLETLAEKSLKGEQAGTQLKNVFLIMGSLDIVAPKALEGLAKYGVDIKKVTDKTIPFNDRLKELSKIQNDGTVIAQVFGKENFVAGQTLLANADKAKQFTDAVTGTNKALELQKDANDNLATDQKRLANTWNSLLLSFSEGGKNADYMRDAVQGVTKVIGFLKDNVQGIVTWTKNMIVGFVTFKAIAIGSKIWGMAMNGQLKDMWTNMKKISSTSAEAGSAGGKMGNALKGVGWTALIALAFQFAGEIYRVASGAAQAEENLKRLEQTASKSSDSVQKRQEKRAEYITKQNAEIDRQLKTGVITETQAAQKRLAISEKVNESIATDIELIKQRFAASKKEYDEIVARKVVNGFGMDISAESDKDRRGQLAANMKAQQAAIKAYEKEANNAGETTKDVTADINALGIGMNANSEDSKKAAQELKNLRDELNNIANAAQAFQEELNFNKSQDGLDSQLAKDLAAAERSIAQKYQKEIAGAQALATEQGAIGIQAAEKLKLLEVLKAEETAREIAAIKTKYKAAEDAEWRADDQADIDKAKAQAESLETAIYEVKKAALEANMASLREDEISERRKTLADLAKLEEEYQAKQLQKEFEAGTIGKEEFDLKMLDLHNKYLEAKEAASEDSTTRIIEIDGKEFVAAMNALSTIVQVSDEWAKARQKQYEANLEKNKQTELAKLDEMLRAKTITSDQYEAKKLSIENDYDEKRKAAQRRADKQAQEIAIFKATIATAVAVAENIGVPVLAVLAAVAGAAQIAAIASTPLPEYKVGGYVGDGNPNQVGGIVHKGEFVVDANTTAAMGLNGKSMADFNAMMQIPSPLLNRPKSANYSRMVDSIRTNESNRFGFPQSGANNYLKGQKDTSMLDAVNRLNDHLDNGIGAYYGDKETVRMNKQKTIFDKVTRNN